MTHEEKVAAAEREAEAQAQEIYEQQQAQLKAGRGPPTDLKDQADAPSDDDAQDKKQLQADLAEARAVQEQQQRENQADQRLSAQKKAARESEELDN